MDNVLVEALKVMQRMHNERQKGPEEATTIPTTLLLLRFTRVRQHCVPEEELPSQVIITSTEACGPHSGRTRPKAS
jgi:hypothetical protein